MKKLLVILTLLFSGYFLQAQYSVQFLVDQPEAGTNDTIYIAGSFNKWNPGDPKYIFSPVNSDRKSLILDLEAGRYEYKFTRGNWTMVEATLAGLDVQNRVIDLRKDTIIRVKLEGWLDRFKDISKLPDSTKWLVAYNRSFFYLERNLDSSYKYAQLANSLVQQTNNKGNEAAMARILGRVMQRQGNHQRALEYYLKQLALTEELDDTTSYSFCLLDIGNLFFGIKEYPKAKSYYYKVINSYNAYAYGHSAPLYAMARLGRIYYNTRQLDSARFYAQQVYDISLEAIDRRSRSEALTILGDILTMEGKGDAAIDFYEQAVEQAQLYDNSSLVAENYQHIAKTFHKNNQFDSSFNYARKAYAIATELGNPFIIADASHLLVSLFKNNGQTDSAFKYLELVVAAKDSLFNQDKNHQLQNILFNDELQRQEIQQVNLQNKIKIYALLSILAVFILLGFVLYKSNRDKRKANKLLQEQKAQMEETLLELKTTQSQLENRKNWLSS